MYPPIPYFGNSLIKNGPRMETKLQIRNKLRKGECFIGMKKEDQFELTKLG